MSHLSKKLRPLVTLAAVVVAAIAIRHGAGSAWALDRELKYTPEELARLEKDGPAPASSTQRFVPDRATEPVPTAASPAPSKAEWLSAADATEVRITDPHCTAKRIREWYRISCPDSMISLVAGNHEDVEVGSQEDARFVFPARMGDRRVAVFLFHAKWSLAEDAVVSEQWLEGDPAPLITVIGIPE